MHLRRNAALAGAATFAALAAPGAASAATLAPLKPCYVAVPSSPPQVERIDIGGSGYTPNSRVDIAVDGVPAVSGAPVDAAGNIAPGVQATAPFIAQRDKAFTVTATDQGNPANVATATSRVTALNVGIQPRRARPSSRVLFRGRGFTGAGKVFAHYRYKGRTRRTVTFTPTGPCGRFTTRKTQIPVSRPGTGSWTVQFDQQKRYARVPSSVFVRLTINVTRTVRFSRTLEGFGLPR
jgi:hypothetical protein